MCPVRTLTLTLTLTSALLALGCTDPKPSPSPSANPTIEPVTTQATNTVSARMQVLRDGDALVVKATIDNGTAAPIWVLDTPLEGKKPSERAIVSRGEPGTARIVLGFLDAESQAPQVEQGVDRQVAPIATRVAAHASRSRTVRLPLPLTPWHPYLQMASLKQPTQVVLEVGYLTAEPVWSDVAVDGVGSVDAITASVMAALS